MMILADSIDFSLRFLPFYFLLTFFLNHNSFFFNTLRASQLTRGDFYEDDILSYDIL